MARIVSGLDSITQNRQDPSSEGGIFAARVKFVILDDKTEPKVFKAFGEWSSIGSLFFSSINNPNPSPNFVSDYFAKPLFPNNKTFPLKNEIVYILALPNSDIQSDVNNMTYYYFQPVNIWNSVHHNAVPDPINTNTLPPSQQQDYQQTSAGSVRRVTDGSTEIDLGSTFKEKTNIKNIQPFEGDIILEGRWGQSFRFGSTVTNSKIINPWSRSGNNGDPIIILKNGQYDDGTDPWIPQIEDINKDGSSIYLTSTQAIPITVASKNYNSYSTAPTSPDKFTGKQIILNSGRLLLNAIDDSILLSANKSINLNTLDSVTIDAKNNCVIDSPKVLLGDKNATESVILGDTFLDNFKQLLSNLIDLTNDLTTVGTPVPYSPNTAVASSAVILQTTAQSMLSSIESFKSKTSKTI
jgi:hypothetical protein